MKLLIILALTNIATKLKEKLLDELYKAHNEAADRKEELAQDLQEHAQKAMLTAKALKEEAKAHRKAAGAL